jgi:hypothetical protein
MAESIPRRDAYLASVLADLVGSRRARSRLVTELGHHLDDAIAAELETGVHADEVERRAIERLGRPAPLAQAWSERCARLRARQRRRVGLLAAAAAAASVLAVSQHADGRGDQVQPGGSCGAPHAAVVRACVHAAR